MACNHFDDRAAAERFLLERGFRLAHAGAWSMGMLRARISPKGPGPIVLVDIWQDAAAAQRREVAQMRRQK